MGKILDGLIVLCAFAAMVVVIAWAVMEAYWYAY